MSGSGSILTNGGGLEALLKAAKFVEEQEKQKLRRQSVTPRFSEESNELKEVPVHNGVHPQINSSRIPTPPNLPKHGSVIREVHNKLEKNRRAHLKECFETLKKQLPPSPDEKKTSNLSILHNAIRYIAVLKRKEREFEHEMERLAREKIAYQQKLATLKKELTAQWEHIDLNTLLPEVVEPEPRRASELMNSRMTETGSEDELVRTSTMYSSTSSLSSASPLHSAVPEMQSHVHHPQVMNSPGPPNLLMSPIQQLLPSTTIRMLPADTHFVHSHIPTTGITIQNGVINHSTVTLAAKHSVSSESSSGTLVAPGILNHSLVMPQSSGSFLLAAPTHLSDKVMAAPILKSISQVPPVIQPQFLVKPTMVVVSAATNTPK
ncbi:max-binding protein MNT-like [Macrosteles quadrilineatus]|uniref:max-binding protein MNT-like n=1 Tax=Macrosteles quadrilineatus TaxID=74068 RepID=UPI0023E1908B|nr:max-binding protein MNT-like [Macrosteles quadrilineatus]XP_054279815.1 max-binding protein MNT-like [Macrosteles quadrilineatus]